MKVIDATDALLGRLASTVAKLALQGEEVAVVHVDKILITGNKAPLIESFVQKRGRVGTVQKGPKHSKLVEQVVKRTIQGMLPNPRTGRGRDALKKIKCYRGLPSKFSGSELVSLKHPVRKKTVSIMVVSK